jgi:hypothetical protein
MVTTRKGVTRDGMPWAFALPGFHPVKAWRMSRTLKSVKDGRGFSEGLAHNILDLNANKGFSNPSTIVKG